jgi:putative DNA-binding protein
MHRAITRPLASGDRTQGGWSDGRTTEEVIAPLIKANARLQPIERLEIYNRMYWFRLLDCVADDSPGLRAFLGDERFWKLAQAYLVKYPSTSYTLRNLCSRLPKFLAEEPQWTAPRTAEAIDLARFEWAQIEAFDGPRLKPLSRRNLAKADPENLRVRLQPHLTVLRLSYPVDEYVMAVKRGDVALRGAASQAVTKRRAASAESAAEIELKKERVDVAVHRSDNVLYYKRMEPAAAAILRGLSAGRPLAEACARAMRTSRLTPDEQAARIKAWFSLWMRLGWICARE